MRQKGNVFVHAENDNVLVRIDAKNKKISARWPVTPGAVRLESKWINKKNRLFVTCHSKVGAIEGHASAHIQTTAAEVTDAKPTLVLL